MLQCIIFLGQNENGGYNNDIDNFCNANNSHQYTTRMYKELFFLYIHIVKIGEVEYALTIIYEYLHPYVILFPYFHETILF